MKTCSICNQIYTDENLNYCLNDGGILIEEQDDAPPTILLNQTRTTNPNYSDYAPPTPWGSQPMQAYQPNQPNQPVYQNYQTSGTPTGNNQTLPILSLVLGLIGVFCCWGGIPFGLAAAIIGYIGYRNTERDPAQYGGRGIAIAGLILGSVALAVWAIYILVMIIGNL